MKKLASILAGLCLVLTAQAQDSPTDIASPDILTQPKFILKTNLTSYAFTAINLNFEAKTSPVTSVGLLGAYMLPRTYDLSALVTDSEGDTFDYDGEIEPSGVFITPYFRYYPSGSMTGFYAETFARYYNMEFGVPVRTIVGIIFLVLEIFRLQNGFYGNTKESVPL